MAGKDKRRRRRQSTPINEENDNGVGGVHAVTSPKRPSKRSRPATTPPDDDDNGSLDFDSLSVAEESLSKDEDDEDDEEDEDEDDNDDDDDHPNVGAPRNRAARANAPYNDKSRFRSRYGDMAPETALGKSLASVYANQHNLMQPRSDAGKVAVVCLRPLSAAYNHQQTRRNLSPFCMQTVRVFLLCEYAAGS